MEPEVEVGVGGEGREALAAYLTSMRIPAAAADGYAVLLSEQGYESTSLFDEVQLDELQRDFKFKRGHLKAVELYRTKTPVAPTAVGEPVGATLADGSMVRILEDSVLGSGGGGVVFEAIMTRRSGAKESVAVKRLPRGSGEKDEQRFAAEYKINLKAALQCGGVGVCQVYGFIRQGGCLCIVMKKYEGSLQDRYEASRVDLGSHASMSLAEALPLWLHLARALQGLHTAGIRVQDLKPGNILFDKEGVPVISDFGISAIEGATQATSVGGTANYMCGEMFQEENITTAIDIWAWAATFVEAVSGKTPWFPSKFPAIMKAILMDQKTPPIPEGLPEPLRILLSSSFNHDPAQRPSATDLIKSLEPMVKGLSGQPLLFMHANALLQGSWAKRDAYVFTRLTRVEEINNPPLRQRYEQYKAKIAAENDGDAHEQLLFHGCSELALENIAKEGFLRKYWTTAAGQWQRFGPGFYFALQASKSHEYPLEDMGARPVGQQSRTMLLCKVCKGKPFRTEQNMDTLQGDAPAGYQSVMGIATDSGPLNYDELVVYNEAAILPYATVTYDFVKIDQASRQDVAPEEAEVDMYVVKATGAILDPTQLFKQGINLTDCRPVSDVAQKVRDKLVHSLTGARNNEKTCADGLAAIDKELRELGRSRANVEATITADLDKMEAELAAVVTAAVKSRREELLRNLTAEYQRRKSALDAQRPSVAAMRGVHNQFGIEIEETLRQGTLALVRNAALATKTCEPIPAIAPVVTREIFHQLADTTTEYRIDLQDGYPYTLEDFQEAYGGTVEWDMATVAPIEGWPPASATAKTLVSEIGRYGLVGLQRPALESYRNSNPSYRQGVAISSNRPVGVDLAASEAKFEAVGLPEGLVLDPETGVLTGTPRRFVAWNNAVKIVARNSAGATTIALQINVKNSDDPVEIGEPVNAKAVWKAPAVGQYDATSMCAELLRAGINETEAVKLAKQLQNGCAFTGLMDEKLLNLLTKMAGLISLSVTSDPPLPVTNLTSLLVGPARQSPSRAAAVSSSPASSPRGTAQPGWEFQEIDAVGTRSKWTAFDTSNQLIIEAQHSAGKTGFMITAGRFQYNIDMIGMMQTNVSTGTQRRIRRAPST